MKGRKILVIENYTISESIINKVEFISPIEKFTTPFFKKRPYYFYTKSEDGKIHFRFKRKKNAKRMIKFLEKGEINV